MTHKLIDTYSKQILVVNTKEYLDDLLQKLNADIYSVSEADEVRFGNDLFILQTDNVDLEVVPIEEGDYISLDPTFRHLNAAEVAEFKDWVANNYTLLDPIPNNIWHPVIVAECKRLNDIHNGNS